MIEFIQKLNDTVFVMDVTIWESMTHVYAKVQLYGGLELFITYDDDKASWKVRLDKRKSNLTIETQDVSACDGGVEDE